MSDVSAYFKKFLTCVSTILKNHIEANEKEGLELTRGDSKFIDGYREFIQISRRYNKSFYEDMFKTWANSVDVCEFLFEHPIDYSLNEETHIYIHLGRIRSMALTQPNSISSYRDLNITLLSILIVYHRDEDLVKDASRYIQSFQPKIDPEKIKKSTRDLMPNILQALGMHDEQHSGMVRQLTDSNFFSSIIEDASRGHLDIAESIGRLSTDPDVQSIIDKMKEEEEPQKVPQELLPPGEPKVPDASISIPISSSNAVPGPSPLAQSTLAHEISTTEETTTVEEEEDEMD